MSTEKRLERLEQQTQKHEFNATVVKVAAHTGTSLHELMSEAQAVADRAQAIGDDAALEEFAHAAGTTAAALRGEAERIGMELGTL